MKSQTQDTYDAVLIDLKTSNSMDKQGGIFDFQQLKLVEKPSLSKVLPQTLGDCVGYMNEFPLLQPNTNTCSVVDMVNILSIPEAQEELQNAMNLPSYGGEDIWVNEWPGDFKRRQDEVYNNDDEPLVTSRKLLIREHPIQLLH